MLKIADILNNPSFYDVELDYKWNSSMTVAGKTKCQITNYLIYF